MFQIKSYMSFELFEGYSKVTLTRILPQCIQFLQYLAVIVLCSIAQF